MPPKAIFSRLIRALIMAIRQNYLANLNLHSVKNSLVFYFQANEFFDNQTSLFSHKTNTFDAIHLMANILPTILSATLLILFRNTPITANEQYFCGPTLNIAIDECDDKPELSFCDSPQL